MNTTNFKPKRDNVLVQQLDQEEMTTAHGVLIPRSFSNEPPVQAVILAVGPGVEDKTLAAGQIVVMAPYTQIIMLDESRKIGYVNELQIDCELIQEAPKDES